MVLAANLFERIADRAQEIGIGSLDGAIELEFDDRLSLGNGGDLPFEIRRTRASDR